MNQSYNVKTQLYVKFGHLNSMGLVGDRVVDILIEYVLKKTNYNKNIIIVEISSGNTGIVLAAVVASRGFKIVVVIPEDVRNYLMLGVIYAGKGIEDAIRRAKYFASKFKSVVIINQFDNSVNVETYGKITAKEIISANEYCGLFCIWCRNRWHHNWYRFGVQECKSFDSGNGC